MEISIPYVYALGLIIAAFIVIGLMRGWLREAATFGGILIATAVANWAGATILLQANHLLKSLIFLAQGGIDSEDPAAVAKSVNDVPLIDLQHPTLALAMLFLVLVVLAYILSSYAFVPKNFVLGRLGGVLIGALNGLVVLMVALQAPPLNATIVVTVTLPFSPVTFLDKYFTGSLVAMVGILIVLGLLTSFKTARRGEGSGWAEKRRH